MNRHVVERALQRIRDNYLIRRTLPPIAIIAASALLLLGPSYFGPITYAIAGLLMFIVGVLYGVRTLIASVLTALIAITVIGRYGLTPALEWTVDTDPVRYQLLIQDPGEPGPTRLRTEFQLDEVAAGTTGTARLLNLAHWVNTRWRHSGGNQADTNDPIWILRQAKAGAKFRCVEYAIILTASAQALDMPARVIGLKTRWAATARSGAGHVVAEVWLDEHEKWVFVDPQYGYLVELDGVPLNAVELQQALAGRQPVRVLSAGGRVSWPAATHYLVWITPYLYYFDFDLDQRRFADSVSRIRGAVMLVPVGAPELEVFQRRYPLRGYNYTTDLTVFYPDMSGRSPGL